MEEIEPSERLKKTVKPIQEGELRVFKLLNMPKDANGKDKPIPGRTTCGVFKIYDKFEKNPNKRNKYLRNVSGTYTEVVEGKPVTKEIVEDVDFNRMGFCVVKHTEPNKLMCLTMANENASNPFRDTSVNAWFYEVKPSVELAVQTEELDYDFEAARIVREAISDKTGKWKQLAKQLGINTDNPTDQIFHDLKYKAKKEPKLIIRSGTDVKLKVQIYIKDAIGASVIMFFAEDREWKYIELDTLVCSVDPGKDENERLEEYLISNDKARNELIKVVNDLYKIAA